MRSASHPFVANADVKPDTLPLQRAYRWEKERPDQIFLTQPFRGQVREWTWAQTMDEARRMASYLRDRDWPRGSHIVILSKNCAWWIMAELAVWMAGHVSVPIYPSLNASSVRMLLSHCDPVACFLGPVDFPSVAEQGIPPEVACIAFPNAPPTMGIGWDAIVRDNLPMVESPVRSAEEVATLIYTSGTTGVPKGVMHRFAAFSYMVSAVIRVVGEGPQRVLSYLPLAHIAERGLVEAPAFYLPSHLYFVESVSTFRDDLRRARPTMFFSVPRLLAKFQGGVLAKLPQPRLDKLLRIPGIRGLTQRKILHELGLERVRIAASGGAPLPPSTLQWFRSVGLNLIEGYGMTETGITHTPPSGESRPGYVGNPIRGVESKLGPDGELLIRSPMNMVGYYKDEEATREAFTNDGFFHTGDLAEIDDGGWLKIVGRIKEQFKTSKGKYVSPAPIEHLLCGHPLVETCCVMGAGMSKAFGLVVLSQDQRLDPRDAVQRAGIEQQLATLLENVNAKLDAHERLHFLVVTDDNWTVDNGFLTPTMKLRRGIVERNYTRHFDEWSATGAPVVWHIAQGAGAGKA